MFDRVTQKIHRIGSHHRGSSGPGAGSRPNSGASLGAVSGTPVSPMTGVYFANWSIYERKHFPTDIDYGSVTHVFYAFLSIDEKTGNVAFSDTWADCEVPLPSVTENGKKVAGVVGQFRQLKQMYPHLKVVFSVGGWGTERAFESVVHDRRKLASFATSCAQMVQTHGFDGIDVDWEYPKDTAQGSLLCVLLEQLRAALDNVGPQMVVSAAVSGLESNVACLDVGRMDRVLSFWNLMCYDFTGHAWSSRTGFHSNLFGHNGDNDLSADAVVRLYKAKGVAPHKLVLGMPLYGRKFAGVVEPRLGVSFDKQGVSDEGVVEFKNISGHETFDHRKVGAMAYDPGTRTLVVYDSLQSAKVKAAYSVSQGLGGGFFWDSAGDRDMAMVRMFAETMRERAGRS